MSWENSPSCPRQRTKPQLCYVRLAPFGLLLENCEHAARTPLYIKCGLKRKTWAHQGQLLFFSSPVPLTSHFSLSPFPSLGITQIRGSPTTQALSPPPIPHFDTCLHFSSRQRFQQFLPLVNLASKWCLQCFQNMHCGTYCSIRSTPTPTAF